MRKPYKTLLFSFFLTATLVANSQTFIKSFEISTPLTWNDFMGVAPQTATGSHAEFYFGYRPLLEKSNDSVIYRLKAVGYFDKGLSFAVQSDTTVQQLRFHQVQFKLLEIHRRELQKELDIANKKTDFEALFRNLNAQFISLKNNFDREYTKEKTLGVLQKWEKKMDSLFSSSQSWEKPAAVYSPWSFGLLYAYDYGEFGSPANRSFNYTQSFTVGSFGAYKNLNVGLNVYNQYFEEIGNISEVGSNPGIQGPDDFSTLRFDFWLGYRFFNNKKLEVMPMIGLSTAPFENSNQLVETNRNKLFTGVTLNYIVNRTAYLSSSPFKERNTYSITGVQLSGFVSRYDFGTAGSSLYYMLSLGINFRGGNMR